MSGICLRYIPHSTPFSKAALKRCELSGGRLFGLTKTKDGLKRSFGLSPVTAENAPVSTTGIYLSDAGNLYLYSGGTVYRSTGAKNNFVKIAEGFASAMKTDLEKAGLPVECPYPLGQLTEAMTKDKKAEGGTVHFILPAAVGDVRVCDMTVEEAGRLYAWCGVQD